MSADEKLEPVAWRDMASAPRDASEIIVRMTQNGSPGFYRQIAHWADGGGEEQPSFQGWFRAMADGFAELPAEPTGWMPFVPASALEASEAREAALAVELEAATEISEHRLAVLNGVLARVNETEARVTALTAEIATLREERDAALKSLREWKHTATNRLYMMEAYLSMLGPVALEVASMWQKAGVVRQHTSWGPEAFTVSGEQRAQWILDWERAPKRRCIDLDNGIYEDDPPQSGREKTDLRAALRQEGKP